ncbi:MAG: EAL domain-containing protein, partial [Oscillospiraceae bacterium]|nr:EAL domain-containing protein [Oscillospiraceae bacterium]
MLTRTTSLIRKKWVRFAFCLPYMVLLLLLAQNPLTHSVFTITAETGYARGPLMMAVYAIAMVYGLTGLIYCIYCRRYLPANKWTALLTCYLMAHAAVVIQFFRPELLVEMFCTALGEMLIMLSIMRPEERMDSAVGMLSWASYRSDIRNIALSGEHVRIVVIRLLNCLEIRNFVGDHNYNQYLSEVADRIRAVCWTHRHRIEIYFERPGTIYLITDADEYGSEDAGERLLAEVGDLIRGHVKMGVCFEPRVCLIRCPEDLQKAEDVISLGHKFLQIDERKQTVFRASDIVHSRTFAMEAHIEEIFDRALKNHNIKMFYQPILDVQSGRFRSAEALARIIDPEYGLISPAVFIPAAETEGFIIPIGDAVLDQVFRFVSEHDLDALGLSYIEINLSVAQCMERSLPKKIAALQKKYGVDPGKINLEITETNFEHISEIMFENVNELIRMGYSFALDDYGTGYSSIQ